MTPHPTDDELRTESNRALSERYGIGIGSMSIIARWVRFRSHQA